MNDQPDRRAGWIDNLSRHLSHHVDVNESDITQPALLPLLHLVQGEDSYITPAGMEFCAEQLDLTGAEVSAVASYIRRSWTNQASVVRPEDVSKYRHTPID